MKIVELEARAEAAEMKLKSAQVGLRKAQTDLEESNNTLKKNEARVEQAEKRAGDNERKGRNLLQRVHELEGNLEKTKADKSKYELAAEENERKFRSANAKLQEASERADRAGGGAKETHEQVETLKDEVAQLKRTLQASRGGSAQAEDSLAGLRKDKDKAQEDARNFETQVTGLRQKVGMAEARADENDAKRKELQTKSDELAIQVEDLNRKLRAAREAGAESSGSSGAATNKTIKLEEQITELEAKVRKFQAANQDLVRQLEQSESGRRVGGNEDTGKEKGLEIKMRAAVERASRNEERVGELEATKKKLSDQVDKLENDLQAARNKLQMSLAGAASGDKEKALVDELKELGVKLDNAELAKRGMAQKLQDALDAEGKARAREAKSIEECRKQEEMALKHKGQVQDLSRQLETAGRGSSVSTGNSSEEAEKVHREMVGLKNKLSILEEKADGLERELRKTKEERDKYSAQSEDDRRKISTLRQATESTGSAAGSAADKVKKLETQVTELEARVKSFQMKASQAEERADRVESQLANSKKAAEEADTRMEKALRDVQAARAEVRKEADRADTLEDQVCTFDLLSPLFRLLLLLLLLLQFRFSFTHFCFSQGARKAQGSHDAQGCRQFFHVIALKNKNENGKSFKHASHSLCPLQAFS